MTQIDDCNIPFHSNLVLGIDDILNEIDPIRIAEHSPDPHEYAPEIPGLVAMIVGDRVNVESLHEVFTYFFGVDLLPNAIDTQGILYRMNELRELWLHWQSN